MKKKKNKKRNSSPTLQITHDQKKRKKLYNLIAPALLCRPQE